MSTKTTTGLQVAPKSFRKSFAKFVLVCLLVVGIYRVVQDPVGSAEAINSAWSAITTFGNGIDLGGGR